MSCAELPTNRFTHLLRRDMENGPRVQKSVQPSSNQLDSQPMSSPTNESDYRIAHTQLTQLTTLRSHARSDNKYRGVGICGSSFVFCVLNPLLRVCRLLSMTETEEKKRRNKGRNQRAHEETQISRPSLGLPAPSSVRTSPPTVEFDSSLAIKLLRKWSWDSLIAAEEQDLALSDHVDEIRLLDRLKANHAHASSSIAKLASVGNAVRNVGSVRRDSLNYLGTPSCPRIIRAQVSCVPGKQGSRTAVPISMTFLLPHKVMAYLKHEARPRFHDMMFIGSTILPPSLHSGTRSSPGRTFASSDILCA